MHSSTFQSLKLAVVSATGLSKDALHVYVGLVVFLATVTVFRRPLKSLWPWLAVLVVAVIGELLDARDDWRSLGHWRVMASLHDVVNTLVWPTVLSLLARMKWLVH
jgi:hypothetical protein